MKIKSIEIENFKLFDKKFDKMSDISGAALVLLNGPNGYGKTSIFDAIELALTGEIKRIHKYSEELGIKKSEAHIKKILIADEKKEAYIKLWLEGAEGELEIQCIYEPPKTDANKVEKEKKPSKENNPYTIFDDFKRSLIVDGEVYSDKEEVNRKLNEYQLNQISDFFDKCCFISQDEHLSFLKKANKDKAAALEFLFEIPSKQKEEADRVNGLIGQLKNKNSKLNLGYIKRLEKKETDLNEEIKQLKDEIAKMAAENETEITYQCLFSGKSIEWDKENMSLDSEKYDEAMAEIEKLKFFSENQQACIDYLYNKPFKDVIKPFDGREGDICRDNPLEYAYRYYSLLKDEKSLEDKYALQKKYVLLKENIAKRELEKINWNFISDEKLLEEAAVESIKEKLEQVNGLQKKQGIVSGVVANITETRTTLMKFVDNAVKQSIIDDKTCPLCGAPYTDKTELDAKIKAQTDILQNLCDDTVQEIKKIKDDLYKEYFDGLLLTVEGKLKETISEDKYQKLQEVKKRSSDINKICELLQQIAIELPEEHQEDIAKIEKGYQDLVQRIRNKLKEVSEEIEAQLLSKDFVHEYEKYYDKNEEPFKNTTYELLCVKEKYVKALFYNFKTKLLDGKETEITKTKDRLAELNRIYEELYAYRDAIENGVKKYKRKVVRDIEPMLYVYTAKILQQKFNGKSIYIKADDKMDNIQFINSIDDEQDILYNMSSGQLAAVSLSFLLCMNQVYAEKVLPVLLIDDPIQTIDDVNMVGLVDILRHEFADRQIFISTHEQKFEWYLKYKYEKTERKMKSFNMKNLLLQNGN